MGEYEGTLVSWTRNDITILVDGEELSWPLNEGLLNYLATLDIQEGDWVRVEVEFNNYTAYHIFLPVLEPRALLARIEELERLIKGLTT